VFGHYEYSEGPVFFQSDRFGAIQSGTSRPFLYCTSSSSLVLGVILRRLKIGSRKQRRTIAQGTLVFWGRKIYLKIQTTSIRSPWLCSDENAWRNWTADGVPRHLFTVFARLNAEWEFYRTICIYSVFVRFSNVWHSFP